MPGRVNIRGCYWDGVMHNRDICEDLQKAINRGEVHYKGRILHLGQKDIGDSIRVPVPVELDGKIIWQKDWVHDQLRKKESEIAGPSGSSNASCVTVEEIKEDIGQVEMINGEPVVYVASESFVEEKRGRPYDDEGNDDRKKQRVILKRNGQPERSAKQPEQQHDKQKPDKL